MVAAMAASLGMRVNGALGPRTLLASGFPSLMVVNVIFAPRVVNFYVCLVC